MTPDRTTVGQLLDRWVEVELPRSVRPENQTGYLIKINNHLKPRFGNVLVKNLTVEAVETFYADLQAQGKSSSLIRKVHMRLSSALRMARRWGMVAENVCEVARAPKLEYRQNDVWEPEEVKSFLEAAATNDMHPYWRLVLETGARTSELLGTTWADVDLDRQTIRFGRQVVRLEHGHPILKLGGKTASATRTIRLTSDMVDQLKAHRNRQTERRLASSEWADLDLVFSTRSGRPINARHVRRSFDRIVAASGVKRISPHGMRRTSITLAIANGANVKAVATRVGHRDISTTIGTYQSITRGMEDDLLEIVEAIMPSASRAAK